MTAMVIRVRRRPPPTVEVVSGRSLPVTAPLLRIVARDRPRSEPHAVHLELGSGRRRGNPEYRAPNPTPARWPTISAVRNVLVQKVHGGRGRPRYWPGASQIAQRHLAFGMTALS